MFKFEFDIWADDGNINFDKDSYKKKQSNIEILCSFVHYIQNGYIKNIHLINFIRKLNLQKIVSDY
jgi:hypothetical protein